MIRPADGPGMTVPVPTKALEATPSIPISRPMTVTPAAPRVWKFWGTAVWGLLIFVAMFLGQIGADPLLWPGTVAIPST